jgi:Flp pilus assembly protein TadG
MTPPFLRHGRQRGQAMVEFVIAATFFLVPLFLGIVILGKFSDVQHTTNMAGRYGAWERTVWYDDAGTKFDTYNGANHKSAGEIGNEIAVRLINDHTLATSVIKNTDKSATTFANGIDPMWHDNEGKAYLDNYDQQSTTITKEAPATDMAGTAISLLNTLSIPGITGTIVPPVPSDTLAVAQVSFNRIAQNSQAYRRLWPKSTVWVADWTGVDFTATGAILSNTWYANGSDSTKAMVEESVPMSKGLGNIAGNAAVIGMKLWDIGGPKSEIGKVAPDVVPADRLK